MKSIMTILFCFLVIEIIAQPFLIGTTEIVFYDELRDRNIPSLIHYPAEVVGSNTPVATGEFPILVFGHGFFMGVNSYENIRDHFVARGYILVLPTTEGGFPDHGAFGADLAFLAQAMLTAGQDATSMFLAHVAPSTALMGHSMGGGASMLGAASATAIQAVVNFAAAETDPSAIEAAGTIQVPTLMFAAAEDCVTPTEVHQQPMYDTLDLPCKALVNILGGGHCYFANTNAACEFGEFTCGPDLSITREQQHSVMNDLAGLWLDHFLKGDEAAFGAFLDSTSMSTRLIAQSNCIATSVGRGQVPDRPKFFPNPASGQINFNGITANARISVSNGMGVTMLDRVVGPENTIETGEFANGIYWITIDDKSGRATLPIIVLHE
ncbi:MAG: T9SS type A sorting domain-containing protein [Bacteroidota bacterium]|nr:T9SS type A sorting domain-containing protein [Bacteroidota bacterium]